MYYEDNVVLCGANAYERKYYFNEDFKSLPDHIKQELRIMCTLFTADVGGIITLQFDDEGNLVFKTDAAEEDILYDEIGAALKVKKIRNEKSEMLEALETYYRVFFLGEDSD